MKNSVIVVGSVFHLPKLMVTKISVLDCKKQGLGN